MRESATRFKVRSAASRVFAEDLLGEIALSNGERHPLV
jgi:hypothetical protein